MRVSTDKWLAETKVRLIEPFMQAFPVAENAMPEMASLPIETFWFARWRLGGGELPTMDDFYDLYQEIRRQDPGPAPIYVNAFPAPGSTFFGMEIV